MKKNFPGKLKNNKSGFSIAEALIAVLILLMVSSVVAAGMPVAAKAYTQVVDSANAQLLLSTTVTALRDELGEANDITVDTANKTVSYTSSTGGDSVIGFTDNGVTITSGNIYSLDTSGGSETKVYNRNLVSEKAAASLVFKINSITYNSNIVKISGIVVSRIGKTDELAVLSDLEIKVIGE